MTDFVEVDDETFNKFDADADGLLNLSEFSSFVAANEKFLEPPVGTAKFHLGISFEDAKKTVEGKDKGENCV